MKHKDLTHSNSKSIPTASFPIHANKPSTLGKEHFLELMEESFSHAWFSNAGQHCSNLEKQLEQHLNVKHCILTANGTLAMLAVISSLTLSGKVILPAFTFTSTANVLSLLGLEPVFCDINPLTQNLDLNECEQLITSDVSAIIPTHLWGRATNIEAFEKLAKDHNIKLIFDAAHAFGNNYKGVPIASFGDAEVFSFHATKSFHTFEGGAITTDDETLAEKLRLFINFGFKDYDDIALIGINAKLSEAHCAMGLANLKCFGEITRRSKTIYLLYKKRLAEICGIDLVNYDGDCMNYHYIACSVSVNNRDSLIEMLHSKDIIARKYFSPGTHKLKPYSKNNIKLPITDLFADQTIILPGGSNITKQEVNYICDLISEFLKQREVANG
ncbi:dTDP-4-amino-4,6-dideoxy-D-glucose transaminase [Pseudoalteromonas sp. P1-9]|uniref:aminotransferase class I/II-fold pyridoxal phosphate-dependent enzyme n=1 Tax=Pseudoalteromonas sp. P1-9 TaxID=1710354 RepID=UPI0006D6017A|nr:aminotransferase class I/II-fold pyridoxal phosphate-dependent enzyme [Pseudoalteromonas sp. P1-9]KPV96556.1 dTDP-4-amino-4,6-dideoxy-D-glucose transaminase [Pseudoalteromonas sp. P1-9]